MPKFLLMVWIVVLSVGSVAAQENISPELQIQLDDIELATSAIRELDRLEATDLTFPTVDELEVFLRQEFDEEFTTEEFADDLLFYVGLDLMEPGLDLETVLFDFLLSQIAGFYDPDIDSMNVILLSGEQPEDRIPLLETITYSHEYVHALQDQHFDLGTLLDETDASENGDYQLAILSLVEGDATHAMTDYTMQLAEDDPFALAEALLSAGGDIGGLTLPEGVPEIIESELLFPYLQGQVFVSQVVEARGWDAINDAFRGNPPLSTEHIYHPETYLAGEMPIEVTLPDFSELLDDRWRLAQDSPVGEFYLREHINTQLNLSMSINLADGWGGDKMHLYVDDTTGDIIWVLYQVWDTAEDATEFTEGYVEFLDSRFGGTSDDGMCWSGDDVMCFTQIDEDETRISYAMNLDMAMALLTYAD